MILEFLAALHNPHSASLSFFITIIPKFLYCLPTSCPLAWTMPMVAFAHFVRLLYKLVFHALSNWYFNCFCCKIARISYASPCLMPNSSIIPNKICYRRVISLCIYRTLWIYRLCLTPFHRHLVAIIVFVLQRIYKIKVNRYCTIYCNSNPQYSTERTNSGGRCSGRFLQENRCNCRSQTT